MSHQATMESDWYWECVAYYQVCVILCAMVGLPKDEKGYYEVARDYLRSVA